LGLVLLQFGLLDEDIQSIYQEPYQILRENGKFNLPDDYMYGERLAYLMRCFFERYSESNTLLCDIVSFLIARPMNERWSPRQMIRNLPSYLEILDHMMNSSVISPEDLNEYPPKDELEALLGILQMSDQEEEDILYSPKKIENAVLMDHTVSMDVSEPHKFSSDKDTQDYASEFNHKKTSNHEKTIDIKNPIDLGLDDQDFHKGHNDRRTETPITYYSDIMPKATAHIDISHHSKTEVRREVRTDRTSETRVVTQNSPIRYDHSRHVVVHEDRNFCGDIPRVEEHGVTITRTAHLDEGSRVVNRNSSHQMERTVAGGHGHGHGGQTGSPSNQDFILTYDKPVNLHTGSNVYPTTSSTHHNTGNVVHHQKPVHRNYTEENVVKHNKTLPNNQHKKINVGDHHIKQPTHIKHKTSNVDVNHQPTNKHMTSNVDHHHNSGSEISKTIIRRKDPKTGELVEQVIEGGLIPHTGSHIGGTPHHNVAHAGATRVVSGEHNHGHRSEIVSGGHYSGHGTTSHAGATRVVTGGHHPGNSTTSHAGATRVVSGEHNHGHRSEIVSGGHYSGHGTTSHAGATRVVTGGHHPGHGTTSHAGATRVVSGGHSHLTSPHMNSSGGTRVNHGVVSHGNPLNFHVRN